MDHTGIDVHKRESQKRFGAVLGPSAPRPANG
jgi:hypothetical protein